MSSGNDEWVKARRKKVPVAETKRENNGGVETVREHPAFGTIGAYRFTSGGGIQLFGSPIKHHGGVTIRICQAKEYYSLHRSWVHAGSEIVDVTLSESQWATFVSTMNVGSGVPCTVNHHQSGPLIPCPAIAEQSWAQKRSSDIKATAEQHLAQLQEIARQFDELMKKPTIRKGDLAEVQYLFLKAIHQAPGAYKFLADSVTEHTESLIESAKGEVTAFVTRMALQFPALTNVAPEMPQLEPPRDRTDPEGGIPGRQLDFR